MKKGWVLVGIISLLILGLPGCDCLPQPQPRRPLPPTNPFTVVLLPDTQYYSLRDKDTYLAQTQWIVDNAASKNIKFVIHLGDITHTNTNDEWLNARDAHEILDNAGIPYSMVPGNHDSPSGNKRNTSRYNNYFGPHRFAGKSWYGDHYSSKNDSNYCFFEEGELRFMVISLGFASTKEELCWASNVIKEHSDRRVIIATHCYQTHGGEHCTNCATASDVIGSGGDDIWNELVRRHSNIFLVVSGHVGDSEYRMREGNAGYKVHEILTDYQFEQRGGENHGNGWLRTLTFVPMEDTIFVESLSVLEDVSAFNQTGRYPSNPSDPVHKYQINYHMSTLPPRSYSYKRISYGFNDITVNQDYHGHQLRPAVAMDDGTFVVVWEDDSHEPYGVYQIYARGFYLGGCEKFSDITVNQDYHGQQLRPDVAMASDGSFVVVWEDDSNENDIYEICAAGFNSDGDRLFDDITVNQDYHGQQLNPAVAIDADGNFVVVWEDDSHKPYGVYQIYAAGFNSDGNREFDDFTVNQDYHGQQLNPDVAMDEVGNFVVVWEDDSNENDIYQIYAAGFDPDGNREFDDFTVNQDYHGQQLNPAVAMGWDGFFVVVWEDDSNENDIYQIYAAGFNSDGDRQFDDITVNQDSSGQQLRPDVAMDLDRSFVVVWEDDSHEPYGVYQIYAAGFNKFGHRLFDDITVNENHNGQQLNPAVKKAWDGSFVVVWEDDSNENDIYEICARGLDKNGN